MERGNLIGYTSGVFDLFHIGHLNILKNAKYLCDYLVVGVTTDEVAAQMKGRKPIIPFDERIEIVGSIKYVDKTIAKSSTNNLLAFEEIHFNVFFKGDDWKDTSKGEELEKLFKPYGVSIQYFPYTKHTSSSILRSILEKL
jgi:glycerol-3-phosphate cytidylyltransferase